jgi:SAM-dependent methyltransferase
MSHLIKKLSVVLDPSPSRLWYNEWLMSNNLGELLDIGVSTFWDYSGLSYCYKSVDTNEKLNPSIVGDICSGLVCSDSFDTVLCNGMYEFVSEPQKMVDEVYKILKKDGKAIFGFVGKDYKPYKRNWKFYEEGDIDFKNFEILEKKDFDNNYHFIICQKK